MKIINFLAGLLLAAMGAALALNGVVIADGVVVPGGPRTGPGLGPTVLGTFSAATGAVAWGKSFSFLPSGWSKKFYFVFLLPVVVFYLGVPVLALRSYRPGEYAVFWLVPFFILSVGAWYWEIRRVLRSPAGTLEFRRNVVPYVPNDKRERLMLILANVLVPLVITLQRYMLNLDTQVAIVVGISSLLLVNFAAVLTVYRLRKRVQQDLPKGYISFAVGVALVCGSLTIGAAYFLGIPPP